MTGLLEGKVAIVTGGTSGIGLASAELFLAQGAKVAVADIQDDLGAALEAKHAESFAYIHTDVTDEASIEALVAATVERFGALDVIFNNAGAAGDPAPILELGSEGFDKTIALLTRSVLLGHKYAARQFQAQGTGGSIITTASAAGLQGGWGAAAYTVAKHALVGVVHQAAAELSPLGIRSNAIAPGIIMTPIMARPWNIPPEQHGEFLTFLADRLGPGQPIGRVGQPEDIAGAALFLASDLSGFVTGAVIPVDGGATAVTQNTFSTDVVAAADAYLAR